MPEAAERAAANSILVDDGHSCEDAEVNDSGCVIRRPQGVPISAAYHRMTMAGPELPHTMTGAPRSYYLLEESSTGMAGSGGHPDRDRPRDHDLHGHPP